MAQEKYLVEKFVLENPLAIGAGLTAGGFSGLCHLPGDPEHILYTLSDRGPNLEAQADGTTRRLFPLPDFAPTIYQLTLQNGVARITASIPLWLREADGTTHTISGRPNFPGAGETPYDGSGKKLLSYDPQGLDPEGIAYDPQTDCFWLCEEYAPSLLRVKRDGEIVERLTPAQSAPVPLGKAVLPAHFRRRAPNRGFEGVAITPDGKYLFAIMQSALQIPDAAAARRSRVVRLLRYSLQADSGPRCAEFIYLQEDASAFGFEQDDLVVSDLCAQSSDSLLIDERDNKGRKKTRLRRIYAVSLRGATDLAATHPGLEAPEAATPQALRAAGIEPVRKTLALDLLELGYPHEKFEGLCMIGNGTVAVVNDNDFNIKIKDGKQVPAGAATEIWLIRQALAVQRPARH